MNMQANNDERLAFEAWCKENYLCSDYSFERSSDGYAHAVSHRVLRGCHANVQMLWEAFRDARAALSHQSPQGWKDMAYAKLGAVRDRMSPEHVDAVQRFLRDEYAAPQPPVQGGKG